MCLVVEPLDSVVDELTWVLVATAHHRAPAET